MFDKILIANRGEIACRIIRTARRLGIQTVAVYSSIDEHALHVKMADESYWIGPAPSHNSYLNVSEIIKIAHISGSQAIHPGYGFLSENASFVAACEAENLCFIGPSADAIHKMGEKHIAKRMMESAGVPVIPGYHGDQQTPDFLKRQALSLGLPILIKAVAGGGGKGMRIVDHIDEFDSALSAAKSEAKTSFGEDAVLLEKYLPQARHIELQIFADRHGNVVHLFERDCSLQRRHQKILEEAPAEGVTPKLRNAMGIAAVNAARAINYEGAGTVEFLLAADQTFYFMEMNTRLQVEHPVTEKITGLDLVEWQLRVASGELLPVPDQSDIQLNGHAIEARICAENPVKNFAPSIGKLDYFHLPDLNQHVRVDTGVTQGDEISVYYDPLIAKLIVWDKDRDHAIKRLKTALNKLYVAGVYTNVSLLNIISKKPDFISSRTHTQWIENHQIALISETTLMPDYIPALGGIITILAEQKNSRAGLFDVKDSYSPWSDYSNWKLNLPALRNIYLNTSTETMLIAAKIKDGFISDLTLNNICHHVSNLHMTQHTLSVMLNSKNIRVDYFILSHTIYIFAEGHTFVFKTQANPSGENEIKFMGRITAPMPGTIIEISVVAGQSIKKGERLAVIEAMKMQHTLYAPNDGIIKDVLYRAGDIISEDTDLVVFDPS